jgi:hypothetical protein
VSYVVRRTRYAAIAGLISSPLFLTTALILSLAQSEFMRALGWDLWPSGLALGPYGWGQVLNFVVLGVLIIAFGLGVGQAVQPGRLSWLGPLFLVVSGAGETLAAFNTDPPNAAASWHGQIHSVAFVVFMISLLIGYLATFVRRDPLWRGSRRYLLLALPLLAFSELPNPWGNLLFFAAILTPLQVMAIWFWRFGRGPRVGAKGEAMIEKERNT